MAQKHKVFKYFGISNFLNYLFSPFIWKERLSYLLVYFLIAHNSQSWARSKPGDMTLFRSLSWVT